MDGWTVEFDAAFVGRDLAACRGLLETNPYLLDYELPPHTYVHRAAQEGWVEFLQVIDDLALPLNLSCEGRTPLFLAAQAGSVETVRFLLDRAEPAPFEGAPSPWLYFSAYEALLAVLLRQWKDAVEKPCVIANLAEIVKLLLDHGAPFEAVGRDLYSVQKSAYARARDLAAAYPGYATSQIVAFMDAKYRERQERVANYAEKEQQRKEQASRQRHEKDQAAQEAEDERLRAWIRWDHRFADLLEAAPKGNRNSLLAVSKIAYLEFSIRKKLPEKSPEEMIEAVLAELEGCDGQH